MAYECPHCGSALIVVRDNVMLVCHIRYASYTTSIAIHLLLTLLIGAMRFSVLGNSNQRDAATAWRS
jgi:hypothetical protein